MGRLQISKEKKETKGEIYRFQKEHYMIHKTLAPINIRQHPLSNILNDVIFFTLGKNCLNIHIVKYMGNKLLKRD
jgi:hypothetical protein